MVNNRAGTARGSQDFSLAAAIAAISVLGFAMGLSFPALSLQLESRQFSSVMIGLNAASQPLGTIASIAATSALVRRFGGKPVALASAAGTAAVLATYPLVTDFFLWCLLRFVQGFLFSMLFAISEAWVVAFAQGAYRSRILSLYMSAFGASLAAGPVAVSLLGAATALPFFAGAAILLCVAIPIAMVNDEVMPEEPTRLAAGTFFRRNWLLVLSVSVFAKTEIASLGLLPVFGMEHGFSESRSALLASAFVAGPIVLQYLIGWLSDHLPKKQVWLGCAGFAVLAYGSLPWLAEGHAIWPLLLCLGAATASFYTFALTVLGERYKEGELVTGTAVFSAVYGVGSLAGSTLTGSAMTVWGANGLPLFLGAMVLVLFICVARSRL